MRSSRVFLILLVMLGSSMPLLQAEQKNRPQPPPSWTSPGDIFRLSLSVSPFTELLLNQGIEFTDGKMTARTAEELQRLLMKYGANEVYARIATNRAHTKGFGDHSLERGLGRARLARSLGLPFNPEIGLFNNYGDLRCQPSPDFSEYPELKAPGPWTSLKLDQMLPILRSYGAIVARQILDTGVKVRIWDLGNEVDFGVAGVAPHPLPGACDDSNGKGWYQPPDGVDPAIGKISALDLVTMPAPQRIAWLEEHIWRYTSRMFAAVAAGIRSVDPGARFSTHVSGFAAERPDFAVAFYRAMKEGGFLPDELGFSFYPSASDQPPHRLKLFKEVVTTVHAALDRPVFIAEFGYPAEEVKVGAFASWNHSLEDYPITPQGQASLIRDLVVWGAHSGVCGFRPWAPETAVPGWEPFALFQLKGKTAWARPSLAASLEGLQASKP